MFQTVQAPEALDISSAGIQAFLDALAASGLEIHGLILLRHGKIACEMAWQPYTNDTPHVLFSLSKSFTSTAVGFAIAEGKLALTDRISDLLPDKLPAAPSDALQSVTVEHLLTMSSGLDPKSDSIDDDEPDWAKHTLSFPIVHTPGSFFHYNSLGSHLLSEIVQRVTGEKMRDYLVPRLFEKIGIAPPAWDESPTGVNTGGWGLHLSSRDIARFGQLLLQDGVWDGERVLPEGWVALATRKHVDNRHHSKNPDWQEGYGFQFWRCQHGYFRGDGMHGQLCWVLPEQDVVIAVTAGLEDMGAQAALLHEHLIPAIDAPHADRPVREALQSRIALLSYPYPTDDGTGSDSIAEEYICETGEVLGIHFHGDTLVLHTADIKGGEMHVLRYGKSPHTCRDFFTGPLLPPEQYLASYGFNNGVLHTSLRMPGAPFTRMSTLTFHDGKVTEEVSGIGFGSGRKTYVRS